MKRKMLPLTGALALLALAPAVASAHTDLFLGLNLGGLFGPPVVAYAPPPVYYAPPPPVYYAPPPPVVYAPAPVYYGPGVVYYGHDGWRDGNWHRDGWHRDGWQHGDDD